MNPKLDAALKKLSVVIPAHNEAGSICETVTHLYKTLQEAEIEHEIIVVSDHSQDETLEILREIKKSVPSLVCENNERSGGFGMAVRWGLDCFTGDAVAIYMADASDSPCDLVRFWELLINGKTDCVFGTRFSRQSRVVDYPKPKLLLNRLANLFIQILFGLRYNDTTNAFKLYRREVIEGVRPHLSEHFNLTVELPLKAIVRGYSYAILSNDWYNRKVGESKLKIKEMGSRYLFIILYCLIEKWLSRGDYIRVKNQD